MRPADSLADPSGQKPDSSGTPSRDEGGPPRSSASAEAFARALRATIATGALDAGPLEATLRAFVAEMRASGEPPERTIIAVKEQVLVAVHRREDIDRTDASALLDQIVHWAIEAYYRAD